MSALRWQRAVAGFWFAWADTGRTDVTALTLFTARPVEFHGPRGGKRREWLLTGPLADLAIYATLRAAKEAAERIWKEHR